jgi:hypothetical protein
VTLLALLLFSVKTAVLAEILKLAQLFGAAAKSTWFKAGKALKDACN